MFGIFFEPRIGGGYRMSLAYEGEHAVRGKTAEHEDVVAVGREESLARVKDHSA